MGDQVFPQSARTLRALERTDEMPPALRSCVHKLGLTVVNACLQAGVSDPARIEQIVYEIWQGARQPQQRTGSQREGAVRLLDWVLIQAGANITAERLLWLLGRKGMVLVPREPSEAMVEASINAIADMGLLTKSRKHRVRLKAAIAAAPAHLLALTSEGDQREDRATETALAHAMRRALEAKQPKEARPAE